MILFFEGYVVFHCKNVCDILLMPMCGGTCSLMVKTVKTRFVAVWLKLSEPHSLPCEMRVRMVPVTFIFVATVT